jgi:SAM-dependent methyltransferase
MPSSLHQSVSYVLSEIVRLKPSSVLDVGAGFGKWGFLCRDYLDVFHGRVYPTEWRTRIDGVEIFDRYVDEFYWMAGRDGPGIYDHIYRGDISEMDIASRYDLIICGDVIEHLPDDKALATLRRLLTQCDHLVLSIPLGDAWLNNVVVGGNPSEKHQSSWSKEKILSLAPGAKVRTFDGLRGPVGVFTCDGQSTKSARCPSNRMLHVHNVAWIGGTGNFVLDIVRAFPGFQHTTLYLKGDAHRRWETHAQGMGVRVMHARQLTRAIVEEIDPAIVTLHNTPGSLVEGEWPYDWLFKSGRYTIAWHHNPTKPHFRADLDIMVSKVVERQYKGFLNRCREHMVLPPCIDAEAYAAASPIEPWGDKPLRYTSAGKSTPTVERCMEGRDYTKTPDPPIVGLAAWLRDFDVGVIGSDRGDMESWCRTVSECQAAGMVVLAQDTGAIPEHVKVGETGFLWHTEADLRKLLTMVEAKPDLTEVRRKSREWAVNNVGLNTMRLALYPRLLKALTMAP